MTKKNAELQFDIVSSMSHLKIIKEHLNNAEKICGSHDASYDSIQNSLNLLSILEFKLNVAYDTIMSE